MNVFKIHMFRKILLLAVLLTILPVNGVDINMHIKAKGVGHKNHEINLDYKYLAFEDTGRGDVILQKEDRELYLNGGLYHKMDLSLISMGDNRTSLWKNSECIKNYEVGAAIHLSYNDVERLDNSEFLKTNNKTLMHSISTKFSGKMGIDAKVVNTTTKHAIFETHEKLIGHFEIEREMFVK